MRTTTSGGNITRLKGVNNPAQGNALGRERGADAERDTKTGTTTSNGNVIRLKGVNNPAQGNALGIADGPPQALKGRHTGTPTAPPGEGSADQAGGCFAPSGLRRFGNGIPRALPWAVVSPPFRRASVMRQRWGNAVAAQTSSFRRASAMRQRRGNAVAAEATQTSNLRRASAPRWRWGTARNRDS